jgi:hypothetical protein
MQYNDYNLYVKKPLATPLWLNTYAPVSDYGGICCLTLKTYYDAKRRYVENFRFATG